MQSLWPHGESSCLCALWRERGGAAAPAAAGSTFPRGTEVVGGRLSRAAADGRLSMSGTGWTCRWILAGSCRERAHWRTELPPPGTVAVDVDVPAVDVDTDDSAVADEIASSAGKVAGTTGTDCWPRP